MHAGLERDEWLVPLKVSLADWLLALDLIEVKWHMKIFTGKPSVYDGDVTMCAADAIQTDLWGY